jgi:K+-sensing histidine kinase KdpD
VLTTVEKSRQFDVALAADHRTQEPVDVVPHIEERVQGVRAAHPDADVQTDIPEEAWVYADWLVGTVLDNVVENVVVHAEGQVRLRVTVDEVGNTVGVRISDNCPTMPENERAMFGEDAETPLRHSRGVGLWLVRFVMESYGGSVDVEAGDPTPSAGEGGQQGATDGQSTPDGNTVVLRFRAAPTPDGVEGWVRELR